MGSPGRDCGNHGSPGPDSAWVRRRGAAGAGRGGGGGQGKAPMSRESSVGPSSCVVRPPPGRGRWRPGSVGWGGGLVNPGVGLSDLFSLITSFCYHDLLGSDC